LRYCGEERLTKGLWGVRIVVTLRESGDPVRRSFSIYHWRLGLLGRPVKPADDMGV
jgi:hypothetical protein